MTALNYRASEAVLMTTNENSYDINTMCDSPLSLLAGEIVK